MEHERIVRGGLASYGVTQLALGAWMVLAPGSFFDALGGFGTENAHYVRDVATWELALGLACLLAARAGARGRGAVLLLAAVQALLHGVNHLADSGLAARPWVGVFDTVSLGLLAAGLLALWRISATTEVLA
ncbi:MAG: hypothetical protein JWM31_2647 [Solirubrobacterales bacterium]|nr:hypothetical protein [Solirubrobacterales bacterium]